MGPTYQSGHDDVDTTLGHERPQGHVDAYDHVRYYEAQRRSRPQGRSTTEQRLRDQLHQATTQENKTKVRRRTWEERRRIQTEKARHRMGRVLANLRQGGWGKKDLSTNMTGMTTQNHDDGSITTTTKDIAAAATRYYGGLFVPMSTDDDARNYGYDQNLKHFINQHFDLWEYDMAITAEIVFDAACACPRNKTTGRDRLATEMWKAALTTQPEVGAAFAWRMNKAMMNYGDGQPDATTTTATMTRHESAAVVPSTTAGERQDDTPTMPTRMTTERTDTARLQDTTTTRARRDTTSNQGHATDLTTQEKGHTDGTADTRREVLGTHTTQPRTTQRRWRGQTRSRRQTT